MALSSRFSQISCQGMSPFVGREYGIRAGSQFRRHHPSMPVSESLLCFHSPRGAVPTAGNAGVIIAEVICTKDSTRGIFAAFFRCPRVRRGRCRDKKIGAI
jgi:hypothetical protein